MPNYSYVQREDFAIQGNLEAARDYLNEYISSAKLDPFDFVESCEPDCDDVRHAYHQGQWDMAKRIEQAQTPVDNE